MKRCSKCGEEKLLRKFYLDRAKKDGLSSACKPCVKVRSRAWREANPDRQAENVRRWFAGNSIRARAYRKRWAAANHEKVHNNSRRWVAANREKVRARERVRYAAAPLIDISRVERRRALKANAPQGDPQEAAAFAEILREGICELCGGRGPIEIDHIEPLSKGGEHGWENFAGLCKSCNARKNAKPLLQHMLDLA